MEAHQSKPDMKRHHGNDESEPNKSQRLDSIDEPEDSIKIVHLNDFCLIKIFENLNLRSLLNVANANGRLRPAVIHVYQRKFGENPVKICDFRHRRRTKLDELFDVTSIVPRRRDGLIIIYDLKTCLRYLRCFGSSVSDLTIDYYYDSEGKRLEYINDYCSDSLIRLKFLLMPNIAIGQFQKIFANVQSVAIADCDLGQQLSTFVKCFPNVRRFEASHSHFYDRFGPKPFRYLEHLSLRDIRFYGFETRQFVADLLKGVHDLKSLKVTGIHDGGYGWSLLDLIKENPSITKLICNVGFGILLDSNDVQRIAAEHPALIELKLYRKYRITADDAIALVRQLNSLKKFQFWMLNSEYPLLVSQLDDEWKATNSPGLGGDGFYDSVDKITLKRN